jgi:hypothetical protein
MIISQMKIRDEQIDLAASSEFESSEFANLGREKFPQQHSREHAKRDPQAQIRLEEFQFRRAPGAGQGICCRLAQESLPMRSTAFLMAS